MKRDPKADCEKCHKRRELRHTEGPGCGPKGMDLCRKCAKAIRYAAVERYRAQLAEAARQERVRERLEAAKRVDAVKDRLEEMAVTRQLAEAAEKTQAETDLRTLALQEEVAK